jgi:cell division protein FtsL
MSAPKRRSARESRRRRLVLISAAALVASLGISVRRSAEGTRVAAELAELQREERAVQSQSLEEGLRVDSLQSRERILQSAARLGLRPSDEGEILYLPDVTTPAGVGSAVP